MVALAGAVSILALGAVFSEGPTAVWRHSGIGAGRAELEGTGANAEQNFMNAIRRQCSWEAEGVETSVAIPATDSLAFVVNGKSDGNAYSDAGTQIGLGLCGIVGQSLLNLLRRFHYRCFRLARHCDS